MRFLTSLILFSVCVCGPWSADVRADDPPAPPGKPAEPPKPGEPKPGDPKPGEPKPGDPPPAPPQTPEEQAAAEEKAKKEAEEKAKQEEEARKKAEEEEAKQAEADELEAKKREEARRAAAEEDRPPPPVAPRPGPPGMVYVPATDSPLAAPPEAAAKPAAEGEKPEGDKPEGGKDDPPAPNGGAGKEGPPAPAGAAGKGKEGPPPPPVGAGGKEPAPAANGAKDPTPGGAPPDKPSPPPAAKPAPPVPGKGKGGNTVVPVKGALIGTKAEDLARLLGTRPQDIRKQFDFERPQHRRYVPEFFIDATEITNAQYAKFLADFVTVHICDGKLPTLVDVAGELLHIGEPKKDDVAWRQLAEQNKDALLAAMPQVMADPKAVWPDAFKYAVLPKRDLTLNFVKRKPPEDWKTIVPPQDRLDHPVRGISALDLDTFAEWAGKHVQSEFEYEYTARGRDGLEYPWGKIWHNNADFCNWGAKIKNARQEADTWSVGSRPKGRSWVGAHDLIGNVAEWTSSWFERYPGNTGEQQYLGAVRIIRGGTAADMETLVLRPAQRNWIGEGDMKPPYPQNYFPWVGGRCAWWPQPGMNQVPFILQRVERGGRIKAPKFDVAGTWAGGDLDVGRVSGAVAEDPDPAGQNGVWVKGRCKSVVVIPKRSIAEVTEEKSAPGPNALRVKGGKEGLFKESESDEPLVLLGVFHTDLPLVKVGVRKKRVVAAPDPNGKDKDKEKKEEKQRGKSTFPDLEEGTCPADTYLLYLWHKKLCLVDSSRDFRCCLTATDKVANIEEKKFAAGQLPACKVAVDDAVNLINVTIALPALTGKGTDPLLFVTATLSVEVSADDAYAPNGWR